MPSDVILLEGWPTLQLIFMGQHGNQSHSRTSNDSRAGNWHHQDMVTRHLNSVSISLQTSYLTCLHPITAHQGPHISLALPHLIQRSLLRYWSRVFLLENAGRLSS
jgi:hypothetical protein